MNKLFLDLEETLIDDIFACKPLEDNVERIRAFIASRQPDSIETFTWAFWEKADFVNWESIAAWFKVVFGRELILQTFDVTKQRIEFLESILGGHIRPGEEFDFAHLPNKERVFEWFIRKNFSSGTFALIDDTVTTKTITMNRGGLEIEIVNVVDV